MSDSETERSASYRALIHKGQVNYSEWRLSIATALHKKNLYPFVLTAPSASEVHEFQRAWAIFMDSLSSTVKSRLSPISRDVDSPDACQLWTELQGRYSAFQKSIKASLLLELVCTRLEDRNDIIKIIGRLQDVWTSI
jgi:hypothetical protein